MATLQSLVQPDAHDDVRALRIHEKIAEGLTLAEAGRLLESVALGPEDLPRLIHRDARTIRARIKNGGRLDQRDSADLIETVRLLRYAHAVLGNPTYVTEWMQDEQPSLGGKSPASFMSDAYGRGLVRDILGRIEHGVYG